MKINSNLFGILEVQDIVNKNTVYVATLFPRVFIGAYILYYTEEITLEQFNILEEKKAIAMLEKDMGINPNKVHIGCVNKIYSIGTYNLPNAVTGMFIDCINIGQFYKSLEKQKTYNDIIYKLEQKRQVFQERQLYNMMAQYDPEAQELLKELDNITDYGIKNTANEAE